MLIPKRSQYSCSNGNLCHTNNEGMRINTVTADRAKWPNLLDKILCPLYPSFNIITGDKFIKFSTKISILFTHCNICIFTFTIPEIFRELLRYQLVLIFATLTKKPEKGDSTSCNKLVLCTMSLLKLTTHHTDTVPETYADIGLVLCGNTTAYFGNMFWHQTVEAAPTNNK